MSSADTSQLCAELTPDPAFLTLAPRVAFRRALSRGLQLAGLAEVPLVGTDHTDLVVAFYLGWAQAE